MGFVSVQRVLKLRSHALQGLALRRDVGDERLLQSLIWPGLCIGHLAPKDRESRKRKDIGPIHSTLYDKKVTREVDPYTELGTISRKTYHIII